MLLTRAADVADMNKLCAEASAGAQPGPHTCVVSALPDPKMLIEIEGVGSLAK